MRSILFIVACIVLIILAIKKYSTQLSASKKTDRSTAHSNIKKNAYALLPEDLKLLKFCNY